MKTFIKALTLVFALATGTSMISVHTDRAHIDQDGPYRAVHQKTALLY
jgi:hypothetical protein